MGGQQQVGHVPQGAVLRERLRRGDVQSGSPQVAAVHQLHQGVLVQNAAPARAEENGILLHAGQPCPVHQAIGLRGVGQGEGHHIGLGQQAVQLRQGEQLIEARDRDLHRAFQPDGAPCSQGLAQLGEGGAHMACPGHQNSSAHQGAHRTDVLIPLVLPLPVPAQWELAVQGQQGGQQVLRHRLAVASGGGGEQCARRHHIHIFICSGKHGLEPLQMLRLSYHLRPGPAQDHRGLGKLLRRGGTAAGVEVDGVWGGGLKGVFFLLHEGEHIQNRFTHGNPPYCPYGTRWDHCTTPAPASQ